MRVRKLEEAFFAVILGTYCALSYAPATAGAATAAFVDISGLSAEKEIKNLAALNVFDSVSGQFHPAQPVTRSEYVRWLVKAQNTMFKSKPDSTIRTAEAGSDVTFVDVPASNRDFKYIQGLANAGYVVGVDKTHFAPAVPLTREQMIAIKAQVDEGAPIETNSGMKMFISFKDKDEIDPAYFGAIHEDASVRTTNNINRIWGSIAVLHPKKPVLRSEAAVSLAKVGGTSAEDALKSK